MQHGWNMTYNFTWRWQLEKSGHGRRVTPGSMSPTFQAQAQSRTHLIWQRLLQSRRGGPNRPPPPAPVLAQDHMEPAVTIGKGKRPIYSTLGKAPAGRKPPATKKTKRGGTCRLFHKAPQGCPYGEECMFTHRCSNCGALEAHGQLGCPLPPYSSMLKSGTGNTRPCMFAYHVGLLLHVLKYDIKNGPKGW